jgi:hypothetical protein
MDFHVMFNRDDGFVGSELVNTTHSSIVLGYTLEMDYNVSCNLRTLII